MVRTCIAAGCNNTGRDGISFFKFPSDARLRQEWSRQVQRTAIIGADRQSTALSAQVILLAIVSNPTPPSQRPWD